MSQSTPIAHFLSFIFSKFLRQLPAVIERIKVGEIIGSFNLQELQSLSGKYSNYGQRPIMLFYWLTFQITVLLILENYMAMSKSINILLLFSQVYVSQIMQGLQLRKSCRPNI